MPSSPPAALDPRLRRARIAVSTVSSINAVLYANLVPRLPAVKDHLDLGNAAFGAAIAAMPVGALLAGCSRRRPSSGSGRPRSPRSGWWRWRPQCSGVAVRDVDRVRCGDAGPRRSRRGRGRRAERSRLPGAAQVRPLHRQRFHALWSIGAVAGGLLGAATGLSVPLTAHLAAAGAVFSLTALVAYRFMLPGPEDAERTATVDAGAEPAGSVAHRLRRVSGRTLLLRAALGALAECEALVQDAGSSWGALYLRGEVGAAAAVAGRAFDDRRRDVLVPGRAVGRHRAGVLLLGRVLVVTAAHVAEDGRATVAQAGSPAARPESAQP